MSYEQLSRDELLAALHELTERTERASRPPGPEEGLLHDLQVHQIELEMQNRELREAHGDLEYSRNRYADLYDFAPVAYCTLDRRGLVQELNLTAATLFGRERQQVLGRPFTGLVRVADTTRFWAHLANCQAGLPAVSELRLFVREQELYVEAVSVPVLGTDGKPSSFRTAFTDITLRKRAEQERALALASEQRLAARLKAFNAAHLEASAALASPDKARREVMKVIVEHAQRAARADWVALTLASHEEHQDDGDLEPNVLGSRDGPADAPCASFDLVYGGRKLATLRVCRTTADPELSSEERETLQLLTEGLSSALEAARLNRIDARENQRLSLLDRVASELEQAHDSASVRDALGRVCRQLLPAFGGVCTLHLFDGESRAQLLCVGHMDAARAETLAAQLREPERARAIGSWLALLGETAKPQLFVRPRDRGMPDAQASLADSLNASSLIVAPLFARHRLLGCFSFARNAPPHFNLHLMGWAQEVAERCAHALDAAALLDEVRAALRWRENLMATISHDLKNPLNAISMSASAMAPEGMMVERRRSHLQVDVIRRSALRMDHMIDDLVSTTMLEAGSFRVEVAPEPVASLLEEACKLTAPLVARRELTLKLAGEMNLGSVMADRERVLRVFSNLLGNAVKFTPPGGVLTVGARRSGDMVRFHVSDTGPGVPEAQRERLFDRYWKGKQGATGLGLGLYIAKSIVEAHGGKIWLDEAGPHGATFCFELRCCPRMH